MFLKLAIYPLLVLVSCGFVSCHTNDVTEQPAVQTIIPTPNPTDTIDLAVISFDTANVWLTDHIFPKTSKVATLDESEVATIDSMLVSFFANDKKDKTRQQLVTQKTSSYSPPVFDLKEYRKQYMAVINDKGEKEVWINCFCKGIEKAIEFRDWKKIAVRVYDGGDCFFNLKLNLIHKTVYDLSVNSIG